MTPFTQHIAAHAVCSLITEQRMKKVIGMAMFGTAVAGAFVADFVTTVAEGVANLGSQAHEGCLKVAQLGAQVAELDESVWTRTSAWIVRKETAK